MSSYTILEKCCFLSRAAAGDPTHYMMEQALEQAELDWRFLSFEVEDDELPAALAGLDVLGFQGVKLAEAFRAPAAELLEALTPRSRRAGSANCLVRQQGHLIGDDTYGAAFVEALGGSERLAGAALLIIGSGRNARSIASTACDAGAAAIHLAAEDDNDEDAVAELGEQISAEAEEIAVSVLAAEDHPIRVPEGVSIVVFAPAAGDEAARPHLDVDSLGEHVTLVDTRLRGSRTGLHKLAAERGATVIDGIDLAARETALTLELWTGMEFDRAPLRELAEEYLGV